VTCNTESRVSLFGFPLAHSVSPALHHAAAAAVGVRLDYRLVETDAEHLAAGVSEIRRPEFLGANVTLPHKAAAAALVDTVSARAKRIGAINTIYKDGDLLRGENTDSPALMRCLRESLGFEPREERVLLLGSGGAARAAAVALLDSDVAELLLWNRTAARALQLVSELHGLDPKFTSRVTAIGNFDAALSRTTLVVNATSAGLDGLTVPMSVDALPAETRLFDMVYGADGTPMVRAAKSRGMRAVDGLWMLVYQASAAFALWTGIEPPETVMHSAACAALKAHKLFHESRAADALEGMR